MHQNESGENFPHWYWLDLTKIFPGENFTLYGSEYKLLHYVKTGANKYEKVFKKKSGSRDTKTELKQVADVQHITPLHP